MSIGAAIYSQLTATSGVTALVSTRIFPQTVPDAQSYPQVVYHTDEIDPSEGESSDGKYLPEYELHTLCIGIDPDVVATIANAVKAALDDQHGTWAGVDVRGVWYEGQEDGVIQLPDAGETKYYFLDQRYRVVTR